MAAFGVWPFLDRPRTQLSLAQHRSSRRTDPRPNNYIHVPVDPHEEVKSSDRYLLLFRPSSFSPLVRIDCKHGDAVCISPEPWSFRPSMSRRDARACDARHHLESNGPLPSRSQTIGTTAAGRKRRTAPLGECRGGVNAHAQQQGVSPLEHGHEGVTICQHGNCRPSGTNVRLISLWFPVRVNLRASPDQHVLETSISAPPPLPPPLRLSF